MFDNVYESFGKNRDVMCLIIPKKDFLFSYEDINKETANDFADNYFKAKGREGIPQVKDVQIEDAMIKFYVSVDRSESEKPMNVPDSLNMRGYEHNRTR